MRQTINIIGASVTSAFAASLSYVLFGGIWWMFLIPSQGFLMALGNGLMAVILALFISPYVFLAFLIGSVVLGTPAYLVLKRLRRFQGTALAATGAILSGGGVWLAFGPDAGPSLAPPIAVSGAIGALAYRAVASKGVRPPPPS